MNLETTRLRGRPRNRWQDGARENGRKVGGEGCQEKVHNGMEAPENGKVSSNSAHDNGMNEHKLNPLEHSVVSDATGLTIHFNMQLSARRLRHRCRLLVILAFCQ